MKKFFIGITIAAMALSSCGTGRTLSGDPNATMAGAAMGSHLGGAIGGLIGDSNSGYRGRYRGSAIGTIIGTIAGAAIGNAITTPRQREDDSYHIERRTPQPSESGHRRSAMNDLKICNIRFIDDNRDHIIQSGENSKVIFEIINEGEQTVHNVVPLVAETTGMKRIYVSPSVMIEQIAPDNGVKYTANISAGERIKNGTIIIHLAITDEDGQEYDWQEFSITTKK